MDKIKTCRKCGAITDRELEICPSCGYSTNDTAKTKKQRPFLRFFTVEILVAFFIFCFAAVIDNLFLACTVIIGTGGRLIYLIIQTPSFKKSIQEQEKQARINFEKRKAAFISTCKEPQDNSVKVKSSFAHISEEKLHEEYEQFANEKYWIMKRAKFGNIKVEEFENGTAKIKSSDGGNFYQTTIHGCTCPYFEKTGEICKHMYKVADLTGFYPLLNDNTEREIVLKVWSIFNEGLIPKFINIFHECKGKGCYMKVSKSLENFANIGVIEIIEPDLSDIVAKKYSKDELYSFLAAKNPGKGLTKVALTERFLQDEKLKKMVKIKEKMIKLNFDEKYQEFALECLNHINYHFVENNSADWN